MKNQPIVFFINSNKRKKTLIICISFLTLSCSAKRTAVIPERSTVLNPNLNTLTISELGITLVSKETGRHYRGIEIIKGFKTKPGYLTKTVNIGDIFINDSHTEIYDLYSNLLDDTFGIAIPKSGGNPIIYGAYESGGGIKEIQPREEIQYKYINVPLKERDYFKQEFIYNGRVGNSIKFIYREYIDDYARPSFTQDLQYDISESDIIGFRGLRIKVMNVSNTNIEYRVLSYFNE